MPAFFSPEEKRLAREKTGSELKRRYEASEKRLEKAAKTGSERKVRQVMKHHHKWEYALLYKDILNSKSKRRKTK